MRTLADVAGLLIAGGRSTRFGSEKAVAELGGVTLMERALCVFAPLEAVAVSAAAGSGAEMRARSLGAPVLHDQAGLPSGPLAGILAGLRWAAREGYALLATAPCDAPLLPSDLVAVLLRVLDGGRAAYAVTVEGEHPLCALWSVDLADPLAQLLEAGEHPPVRRFLAAQTARPGFFADARAFANANTLEALQALEIRA